MSYSCVKVKYEQTLLASKRKYQYGWFCHDITPRPLLGLHLNVEHICKSNLLRRSRKRVA